MIGGCNDNQSNIGLLGGMAEYSNLPRWMANKVTLPWIMCSDIMRCPRDTVWKSCEFNREKNRHPKKNAAWALAAGGSGFSSAETLRIAEWYDGDPSYPLPLFKANPVRTQVL